MDAASILLNIVSTIGGVPATPFVSLSISRLSRIDDPSTQTEGPTYCWIFRAHAMDLMDGRCWCTLRRAVSIEKRNVVAPPLHVCLVKSFAPQDKHFEVWQFRRSKHLGNGWCHACKVHVQVTHEPFGVMHVFLIRSTNAATSHHRHGNAIRATRGGEAEEQQPHRRRRPLIQCLELRFAETRCACLFDAA